MSTTIFNQSIPVHHVGKIPAFSFLAKFIDWSRNQEENRLLWLAFSLTIHGCILAPIAILAVMLAGNALVLFMLVIISMGMSLVTNLAAMPTKITIPIFALSILIDIGVFIACAVIGLS
jgi:hypothetical protein